MNYETLFQKATEFKQEHIFEDWETLTDEQKESLLTDVSTVDFALLQKLFSKVGEHAEESADLQPCDAIGQPTTDDEKDIFFEAQTCGQEAIRSGKVAAFVVAGGQGSRLGYDGPKGKFKVTTVKNKSLFEVFAQKILAIEQLYETTLPWYIMTSDVNNDETVSFFEENSYFGLQKENVFFFTQEMIPALDTNGKIVMKSSFELFKNPNGHGGSISGLFNSGAITDMNTRGIEYVFYFQVDNPLIQIADPVFMGHHIMKNAEMSAKVLPKISPEEKVGVFGYNNGKLGVIEYSDLSEEEMYAKDDSGNLLYNAGNIAVHVINVSFIEKENEGGLQLPYHIAKKKIASKAGEIDGIKFETFVFDAFHDVSTAVILEGKREEDFAPVKNKEGADSIVSSREMQNEYFAKWLDAAGVTVPRTSEGNVDGNIEVSPLYALTQESFVERYEDCPTLESGFSLYIE